MELQKKKINKVPCEHENEFKGDFIILRNPVFSSLTEFYQKTQQSDPT